MKLAPFFTEVELIFFYPFLSSMDRFFNGTSSFFLRSKLSYSWQCKLPAPLFHKLVNFSIILFGWIMWWDGASSTLLYFQKTAVENNGASFVILKNNGNKSLVLPALFHVTTVPHNILQRTRDLAPLYSSVVVWKYWPGQQMIPVLNGKTKLFHYK
jgi:hypothetical protein